MASRGVNKVILLGRVGQDPEIRYMPNGTAVANISLATSEQWIDKQTNEKKELTEWHRVVLFGKVAEVAGEYVKKGSQLYIEGQLRTRKWTDQAGVEKYSTEIVVNVGGTMQMVGPAPGGAGGGSQQQGSAANTGWGQPQQPQHQQQQQQRPPANQQQQYSGPQNSGPNDNAPPMDFDDDIPF